VHVNERQVAIFAVAEITAMLETHMGSDASVGTEIRLKRLSSWHVGAKMSS